MSEGIEPYTPVEPYTPYEFRKWGGVETPDGGISTLWIFYYDNRQIERIYSTCLGQDELGAFIEATKYLEKLKKKADANRARRVAKKGADK